MEDECKMLHFQVASLWKLFLSNLYENVYRFLGEFCQLAPLCFGLYLQNLRKKGN